MTKVATGISRAKAAEHIRRVVANAKRINAEQLTAYTIEQIAVFGSYLNSEKQVLGDIDFWVWHSFRSETSREEASQRAPEYIEGLHRIYWPATELIQVLRGGRYATISIHDPRSHDLAKMGAYQIVWRAGEP